MSNKYNLCKKCENCLFDLNKGILCGLTHAKPNFIDQCPDFLEIESEEEKARRGITAKTGLNYSAYTSKEVKTNPRLLISTGITSAIVGSIVWVMLSIPQGQLSNWGFILLAVFIAICMRALSKTASIYAYTIAGISLILALILSHYFFVIGTFAKIYDIGIMPAVLNADISEAFNFYKLTFKPINLVFYVLGLLSAIFLLRRKKA